MCFQIAMTTFHAVHDSTTSSSVVNASDVTTAASPNVTELSEGGCGEDGTACNVTQTPVDLALCTRLAPPPVPPWLRDSPSRLHELTRHCRSWTLYNGKTRSWTLCNGKTRSWTLCNGKTRSWTLYNGKTRSWTLCNGKTGN